MTDPKAPPQANASASEALPENVEKVMVELANTPMQLSLKDWQRIYGTIRAHIAAQAEKIAALEAENKRLREAVKSRNQAISSLLDFAQCVGGSSSYWDETWPEYQAALAQTAADGCLASSTGDGGGNG